jgi:hypothetical protein
VWRTGGNSKQKLSVSLKDNLGKNNSMTKINFISTVFLAACLHVFGQHQGLTFQDAEKQGISIKHLDGIYKSAVHSDTSLAVFKTETEQEALQQGYVKLLQDLGKFLSDNNFKWEKPTRCFNRIYFSAEGTIDYFFI